MSAGRVKGSQAEWRFWRRLGLELTIGLRFSSRLIPTIPKKAPKLNCGHKVGEIQRGEERRKHLSRIWRLDILGDGIKWIIQCTFVRKRSLSYFQDVPWLSLEECDHVNQYNFCVCVCVWVSYCNECVTHCNARVVASYRHVPRPCGRQQYHH